MAIDPWKMISTDRRITSSYLTFRKIFWIIIITKAIIVGWDVEKKEFSFSVGKWKCKFIQPIWKKYRNLSKIKNGATIGSHNPTSGTMQKIKTKHIYYLNIYVHTYIHWGIINSSQNLERTQVLSDMNGQKSCSIDTQEDSNQLLGKIKAGLYYNMKNIGEADSTWNKSGGRQITDYLPHMR